MAFPLPSLDEPTPLPEGAEVELNIVPSSEKNGPPTMSIEEELDRIWADVPDSEWEKLPADLTDQIDHYVYGTPKR